MHINRFWQSAAIGGAADGLDRLRGVRAAAADLGGSGADWRGHHGDGA